MGSKKEDDLREPFNAPENKKRVYNRKKNKPVKSRLHIYLTQECLQKVDQVAEELGLDRSPCLQMLINVSLNDKRKISIIKEKLSYF